MYPHQTVVRPPRILTPGGTHRPDIPCGVRVLPGQPKVQHVALPVGGRQPAHGKVGLWEDSSCELRSSIPSKTHSGTAIPVLCDPSLWTVTSSHIPSSRLTGASWQQSGCDYSPVRDTERRGQRLGVHLRITILLQLLSSLVGSGVWYSCPA